MTKYRDESYTKHIKTGFIIKYYKSKNGKNFLNIKEVLKYTKINRLK